jgi:peptide/nickel transport system permease protein
VLLFVPTLLIASLTIFMLMRVLPGDVASVIAGTADSEAGAGAAELEQIREELGLNDPLPVQYGRWIWSMVNGQFGGESLWDGESLRGVIGRRLPITLQLASYTLLISTVSIPLGVVAALNRDRWPDYLIRIMTITGVAIPNFWIALLIILGLVLYFSWTPPLIYENLWESPGLHMQKMIWPALTLAWGYSSYVIRIVRSNVLEVMPLEYIRTARSKGLSSKIVVWRHVLRNALIPVITLAGLQLAALLSGTVILESIFGLPGIGQGIVLGAQTRDYPVVQSLAMVLVFMMLGVNLIVDLAYGWIDPRISYS